jgi:uncharacterized protein YwbE
VLSNAVKLLLGEDNMLTVSRIHGLQVSVLQREQGYLINLVNGVGQRPLSTNVPLHNNKVRMKLEDGQKAAAVRQVIDSKEVDFQQDGRHIEFVVEQVDVWEALYVELSS